MSSVAETPVSVTFYRNEHLRVRAVYVFAMKTSSLVVALAAFPLFVLSASAQAEKGSSDRTVTVSGPTDRLSRATTNAVSSGIPFNVPQPPKKDPEPAPAIDPNDADHPANEIIRLPSYIVREPRPPVFREKDIHTKKGLGELAVNRYFSETAKALNKYTLPFVGMGSESYAMMMLEEDERVKNLEDARQKISQLRETDPVAAEQLKREIDQTFIRRSSFSEAPGGAAK